jgi:predicted SAM-dependent methyltransferase
MIAARPQGTALLNLGCGSTGHPAFVNVDLHPGPGIISHDLRKGVPFPDGTYDLVYHSTMLSHFRRPEAVRFMQECHRVLKPGGILRVVTEDLEQLCRIYLKKVDDAWNGDQQAGHDHEWLLLEMFDQPMRERSGGEMLTYLMKPQLPNEPFIRERVGEQGAVIIAGARKRLRPDGSLAPKPSPGLLARMKSRTKQTILTMVAGSGSAEALAVGRFRLFSGSASYGFYDRYSLRELFRAAGFSDVSLRSPDASGFCNWSDVNLDVSPSGQAARPHTLIMEGVRGQS